MKTKSTKGRRPFQLKLLGYGNNYYIERTIALEAALAKKPRRFQIDLIGEGEIPADSALLIRSVLNQRPGKARVITNARSSLTGGSVLVWLSGDTRIIREDARIFFRRPEDTKEDEADNHKPWKSSDAKYSDSETDPEEADYARMLQVINEFLPVKELAGRLIQVPVLRQFGLVESEKLNDVLNTAFSKSPAPDPGSMTEPGEKSARAKSKVIPSGPLKK
jgi:hypothetical protein